MITTFPLFLPGQVTRSGFIPGVKILSMQFPAGKSHQNQPKKIQPAVCSKRF